MRQSTRHPADSQLNRDGSPDTQVGGDTTLRPLGTRSKFEIATLSRAWTAAFAKRARKAARRAAKRDLRAEA